jgi:hypothetical protein
VDGGHGQNVEMYYLKATSLTVFGGDENCGLLLNDVSYDKFKFITGNMFLFPFDDGEYDLILSYRIMAHIGDWRRFVKELHRVSNTLVVYRLSNDTQC